ncbi:PREDICTED: defensin-like protein 311 [Camelina sativa]|uniref:Defensin-like protein 311 n=1 Tax=Camelina sativa TaxID=90675 RepID=A0ABM1QZB4_CAMSA|nr:PREDICTED: defensin-like protein 311 [Camelina sativa]
MEKISAFFIILFLVSSCMVSMSVGDICKTDRDCVEIGFPRCKNTGKMPTCYNGYCSCFAPPRRFSPPPPPPPPPHSSTPNSPSSSTSKF